MRNLEELAASAGADNRRAQLLRRTIQVVGEHHSPESIEIELTLRFAKNTYLEAEEVIGTIKRLWPTIWEATMRAAASEIEEIEARYAPLLDSDQEGGDND